MEWSVHVASVDDIAQLDLRRFRGFSGLGSKLHPTLSLTFDLIEEYFGNITFSRCVYGNEFCEHLIPSREKLEAILAAADNVDLPVTFLTPYCSDAGIEALKPLFHLLSLSRGPVEVVFNEWGVL